MTRSPADITRLTTAGASCRYLVAQLRSGGNRRDAFQNDSRVVGDQVAQSGLDGLRQDVGQKDSRRNRYHVGQKDSRRNRYHVGQKDSRRNRYQVGQKD